MSWGSGQEVDSVVEPGPPSLCVVMPALDEADGIVDALVALDDRLSALVGSGRLESYEVVLVDDGSSDRTGELAAGVAAGRPAVRVVRHDHNRGVGAALRTGLTHATKDLLLYTDADMPVDPAEIDAALDVMARPAVDMVVGYRSGFDGEPWTRRMASELYDLVVMGVLGSHQNDVNFPFKMLRVEDARMLGICSEGAFVDVELLGRAAGRGLRIESLEMTYRMRQAGDSKTMSWRLLRRLVGEMLRHGPGVRRSATMRRR